VAKKTAPAPVGTDQPEADQPDPAELLRGLQSINERLTALLAPVIEDVEAALARLEGRSFGLGANDVLVSAIQQLLNRLGLRVRCPRCSEPASLRCRETGNARDGSFQLEHYASGRQTNHGGGTTFPALTLVSAPPDRRRARKDDYRHGLAAP
jgi:hypothetical protein